MRNDYGIGVVDSQGAVVAIMEGTWNLTEAEEQLERLTLSLLAPGVTLTQTRPQQPAPSRGPVRRKSPS